MASAAAVGPAQHSTTVLRWATEPSDADVESVRRVFEDVRASWVPLDFSLDAASTCGVRETVPFMHIPHEPEQVFWRRRAR